MSTISVNSTASNGTNTTLSDDFPATYADPDVAGPGVVLGFILTGFLTLLASELTMWLRQLDDSKYMEQLKAPAKGLRRLEKVWRCYLLSLVKLVATRLAPKNTKNASRFWALTLERLTLNLADQQLITGLLILVSALIRYVPISDFTSLNIACDAALFSLVTHLASLRTLRSYLREHFQMAVCRIFIVGVINTIVIATSGFYSNILTGVLIWLSWSIGLSVLLSDQALTARIAINAGKSGCPDIELWIQSIKTTDVDGSPRKIKNPITILALPLCKQYIAAKSNLKRLLAALAEMVFGWHLLSPVLWLVFIGSLTYLCGDMSASGTVSSWGFGQLLPTFLVLLPFFTLIETYGEEAKREPEIAADTQLQDTTEPRYSSRTQIQLSTFADAPASNAPAQNLITRHQE